MKPTEEDLQEAEDAAEETEEHVHNNAKTVIRREDPITRRVRRVEFNLSDKRFGKRRFYDDNGNLGDQ